MPGIGQRIKRARESRGWSQPELASAVGVSQATVSRWESGKAAPEDAHMNRLARITNTPAAYLKYGADSGIGLPTVSVVGYVGAGEAVIAVDDHAMGSALETVPAPPGKEDQELVAVRIRGNSMRPLRDGWIVYYGRDQEGIEPECLNQVCVVRLVDGTTLIKELRRGFTPGRFTLVSWSAGTDPIEDAAVVWASPVVAIVPS